MREPFDNLYIVFNNELLTEKDMPRSLIDKGIIDNSEVFVSEKSNTNSKLNFKI
jgi:hypothetical protein